MRFSPLSPMPRPARPSPGPRHGIGEHKKTSAQIWVEIQNLHAGVGFFFLGIGGSQGGSLEGPESQAKATSDLLGQIQRFCGSRGKCTEDYWVAWLALIAGGCCMGWWLLHGVARI